MRENYSHIVLIIDSQSNHVQSYANVNAFFASAKKRVGCSVRQFHAVIPVSQWSAEHFDSNLTHDRELSDPKVIPACIILTVGHACIKSDLCEIPVSGLAYGLGEFLNIVVRVVVTERFLCGSIQILAIYKSDGALYCWFGGG